MALTRIVIFVPDSIVAQYEALADSVADSRSAIIRWTLENCLPQARNYVASKALAAGGFETPAAALPQGSAAGPRRPRRRGRPPASEQARRVVHLEHQARLFLEVAPDLEAGELRAQVAKAAAPQLGLRPDSPLIDQAVANVMGDPADRPPERVPEARPPKG